MLKVVLPNKVVANQQAVFNTLYDLLVYMRTSKVNYVTASQYTHTNIYCGKRFVILTGKNANNFDVSDLCNV